jgi:hypothetical protein
MAPLRKFLELSMADDAPMPTPIAAPTAGALDDTMTVRKPKWRLRLALAALGVLFTVNVVLMWVWSREPARFDVSEATRAQLPTGARAATGATVVSTLIRLNEGLWSKSGGYISNDKTPPGVFLDNMPNFEFGQLQQLRDMASALRNDFSRSQSQSLADKNLEKAQPLLMGPNDSWLVPSTESQYRKANVELAEYVQRLTDPAQPGAQFYARADNLEAYLRLVEKQLGSLSQRLSASVTHTRHDTDLANDASATQSTPAAGPLFVQTPWRKIDDNFYEARGAAYALIHLLKAVQIDFKPVLANKNAEVTLLQIVRELEETQGAIWSPVVLNGGGFGFFANHSLVMANYISRASAQIAELRALLARG